MPQPADDAVNSRNYASPAVFHACAAKRHADLAATLTSAGVALLIFTATTRPAKFRGGQI
jgi:hypothetical protein